MKKIFNYGGFIIAIIICFASALLRVDFAKVDDIPYHEVINENVVMMNAFTDINNEDGKLTVKGTNVASAGVSLKEGNSFIIEFEAYNPSDRTVEVHLDLYAVGFDRPTEETTCLVKPGDGRYTAEVTYYRSIYPEECWFRIFSYDEEVEIEIKTLQVSCVLEKTAENGLVVFCVGCANCCLWLSLLYIVICIGLSVLKKKDIVSISIEKIKEGKDESPFYILLTGIVIAVLAYLYREANIEYPLVYAGGDDMGIYYLIKTIKEYGVSLVTPMAGGLTGGDMFDYTYSDKMSFLIIKFLSIFTNNIYLIANLFYFLSYILISYTSYFVCRKLKLSRTVAMVVAVLYTFSPFIQTRYSHMWLVPYYMLPLACMLAIHIIEGNIRIKDNEPKKISRQFWNMCFIAYFCSFTGMYYAFFSCALFAIAMIIRIFNAKKDTLTKELYPLYFILFSICGVITNIMPNVLYWKINGVNPVNEMSLRTGADAEIYGLKLTQLLLPRLGHRIPVLAEITADYSATYPLVNENSTATLGIIGSIGFVVAIAMLFVKIQYLYAETRLIIATFLIATIGGGGALISAFVSIPMRCYNRMSLVILFLSLIIIGKLLEKLRNKCNKHIFYVFCELIILLGVFDQTIQYEKPNYVGFESTRRLIDNIEATLDTGDMVFVLPYGHWPSSSTYKNHIGYVESDNLRWSYGAMQGREEAVWQQKVSTLDAETMITILREAGYDGVYFDAQMFTSLYGNEQMATYSNNITYALGYTPVVSEDGTTYFWDIRTE